MYVKGDVTIRDSLKKKWVNEDWGHLDRMVLYRGVT